MRPVDSASLAAFRIIFGALMFGSLVRFAARGWIDQLYLQPTHHFTFYGFSWVHPWPAWGLYLHFTVLALLALAILFGWRYRVCCVLFFLGFAYIELLEKTAYLNHYYLVSILAFLLIGLPAHRNWSLDARRRPEIRSPVVPFWMIATLRLQLALVYFYAALAKIHPDWLLRAQPLRIWLSARNHFPVLGQFFDSAVVAYAFSWCGFLFDLCIPLALSLNRSRPWAYAVLVAFHAMTAALFSIGLFPWLMIGSALIFFPPDWPRRIPGPSEKPLSLQGSEVAGQPEAGEEPGAQQGISVFGESSPWFCPGWFRGSVLGLHFTFQVLFPLRHVLYPGDRMWTEEGFRFAWHVMVKHKTGLIDFEVTDPDTGRTWQVDLSRYVTPLQRDMMAIEPDMILECAHWIARDLRQAGHPRIQVRAHAYAAMNGRRSQALIDPTVDLAAQSSGLFPKPWIVPLQPRR